MKRISNNQYTTTSRSAFTLLELLAVIVIISILISLILPAVSGVLARARQAEVTAEISRFETAISSFKSENQIEPWSEIVLTEDSSVTAWRPESRTKLRRMFPSFTFTGQIDFNNDGAFDGDTSITPPPGIVAGEIELTASECLVFFLGGMQTPGGVAGFSKNPLSPFSRTATSRTDQFFEFSTDRLIDTDGDGMFQYVDPTAGQTTPYHFASSNNGQDYTSDTFRYLEDGVVPWKRSSHQIISPGEDGEFVNSTSTNLTPIYTTETNLTGDRLPEADNISNFSGGKFN